MIRSKASRMLGAALAALFAYAAGSKETNDKEITFYSYTANELTKTEFRSCFWGNKVIQKSAGVLSRTFRLNTTSKSDEKGSIAWSAGSPCVALRQLNICPA
jgi:hypothetical protein